MLPFGSNYFWSLWPKIDTHIWTADRVINTGTFSETNLHKKSHLITVYTCVLVDLQRSLERWKSRENILAFSDEQ